MKKTESGFSLIEMLVSLVVVGFLFYFLFLSLDFESVTSRVRNSVLRSSLAKITLSVEGFRSAYDQIPNEQDFFSSLKEKTSQMDTSCDLMGFADYDCRFLLDSVPLPKTCDATGWRSDNLDNPGDAGNYQCYMRYTADAADKSYRLYAKTWNKTGDFLVYENGVGFFYCPIAFNDLDVLESCQKL